MAILGKFHQQGFTRRVATWDPKMVITQVPGGPPWAEFGMHVTTIPPKVFSYPKGANFN